MIDQVPGAGSPGASPTSSCAVRSMTGCPGRGARSCICAWARPSKAGVPRTGRTLADLAHHFAAAAPFGPQDRAIEYNVLAARAAAAALAFDEAAARLRTALELDGDPRPELLLELGEASHRAGHALDALEAFRAAAAIGRERGDPALLARAAIGYEEACWRPNLTEHGGGRAVAGGGGRARPRGLRAARRAARAGSPARSTSRASASAPRRRGRARSRWRAGWRTAPDWPRS